MAKFSTGNRASGRARQLEIAAENKIAIEKLTAELIDGLGRAPSPGEVVEAEVVATTLIKARRLRENGRDDRPERELLSKLMRETVYGSQPAPPPAQLQHGATVAAAFRSHDAAVARAASREPWAAEAGDTVTDGATAPDEVSKNAG